MALRSVGKYRVGKHMACLPSRKSVTFYELYESLRHFEGWRDVFFHVLSLRVRRWMWVHGGDLCKFGGANNKACEDLEFYGMKTLRRRLVEILKHLRKCQGTPNHHEIHSQSTYHIEQSARTPIRRS